MIRRFFKRRFNRVPTIELNSYSGLFLFHLPKLCLIDDLLNQARFRLRIGLISLNCRNEIFRDELTIAVR